jgi:competence protein ComEA
MEKIDINAADQETLDAVEGLKGHGHEIVRYREERGGFKSLRELDEVPGLTGKLDEETRGRLRVGGHGGDTQQTSHSL